MKVLVLGCGPAGLMAAHAAAMLEHEVLIFSNRQKPSRLNGCQYLHVPIPQVTTDDPVPVSYQLVGTPREYADKVYGSQSGDKIVVSPETLEQDHLAWDIRKSYDTLWRIYGLYVQRVTIAGWIDLREVIKHLEPDVVLSTIPAHLLCTGGPEDNPHEFLVQHVWAMGDAPGLDVAVPIPVPESTIICDGTKDRSWYRAANVFDHKTVEWPYYRRPPYDGVVEVSKPLSNTCDCHEKRFDVPVARLGRYGEWKKGVLSHTAFFGALQFFGERVTVTSQQERTLPGL